MYYNEIEYVNLLRKWLPLKLGLAKKNSLVVHMDLKSLFRVSPKSRYVLLYQVTVAVTVFCNKSLFLKKERCQKKNIISRNYVSLFKK